MKQPSPGDSVCWTCIPQPGGLQLLFTSASCCWESHGKAELRLQPCHVPWGCAQPALHIGMAFQISGTTSELLRNPPKRSHFPLLPFKFVGQSLASPSRYHPLRQRMMLNTRLWLFLSNILGKSCSHWLSYESCQIRIGPAYGIFPGHSQTGQIVTAL